ncbi:MAG: histone deacetylase [Deltaproteobacteria bacterium]|nr:histone deacetylase [Deltaproteobacteria bacterium]
MPRSSLPTGIFYHPSFSRRSYLTVGSRLADFPGAMDTVLKGGRARMYEPGPVSAELLLKVHTPDLIEGVKADPLCSTAWHSAGGVVTAGEKIAEGEIANAFAFIGAGGHHSGSNFFGGYCCFNDVALCIVNLREKFGWRRFAILDTDAHHGDGTRDLFLDDTDILHVCVCGMSHESPDGTKVDLPFPDPGEGRWTGGSMNDLYFDTVSREFPARARSFRPDLVFWYFGFDTHQGDYGDIGLTGPCYWNIAALMRDLSEEICGGRLEVVLGGGSHTRLATYLIPPILDTLAGTG